MQGLRSPGLHGEIRRYGGKRYERQPRNQVVAAEIIGVISGRAVVAAAMMRAVIMAGGMIAIAVRGDGVCSVRVLAVQAGEHAERRGGALQR